MVPYKKIHKILDDAQNFLKARCARSKKIGMPKQLIQKTKLTFLNSSHRALSHIKSGFFLLAIFLFFRGLALCLLDLARISPIFPDGPDFPTFANTCNVPPLYRSHTLHRSSQFLHPTSIIYIYYTMRTYGLACLWKQQRIQV